MMRRRARMNSAPRWTDSTVFKIASVVISEQEGHWRQLLGHVPTALVFRPIASGHPDVKLALPCIPTRWKVDNSRNVITKIGNLLRSQFMADVQLLVGPNQFRAHRLILSSCSPVFETMFSPRWTKITAESTTEIQVVLNETLSCEKVFDAFLTYLYTCKIDIDLKNVLPVLKLADKYLVDDLSVACKRFMKTHMSLATVNNMFFKWLQYLDKGCHLELSSIFQDFAVWNLPLLMDAQDLSHLDPDIMIDMLERNDLVAGSEFSLFVFVASWLELRLKSVWYYREKIENADEILIKSVMDHIRFPIMRPEDFALVQATPLVSRYKDYFMWRIGVSMAYQSGQQVQADRLVRMMSAPNGHLVFTPRLYTENIFSFLFQINNYVKVPFFVSRRYYFSSRTNLAADAGPKENSMTDWTVDVYPRGVHYDSFYLIHWDGMLECPKHDKRTIRLCLKCQRFDVPLHFKIGICIFKCANSLEYICNVVEKKLIFDQCVDAVNIDDVIDYDEVAYAVAQEEMKNLKIRIIIMPLDKYCRTSWQPKPQKKCISQSICDHKH